MDCWILGSWFLVTKGAFTFFIRYDYVDNFHEDIQMICMWEITSIWWYTMSRSRGSGSAKKYISGGCRPELICFFENQSISLSISPEWCDFSYISLKCHSPMAGPQKEYIIQVYNNSTVINVRFPTIIPIWHQIYCQLLMTGISFKPLCMFS